MPDQAAPGAQAQPPEATPPTAANSVPPSPAVSRGPWSLARRAMTSVATGGGSTRRLGVAGRRYVTAKGGAKKAATASAAGRATTAGLGGFLSNVANGGFAQAAQSLGLQTVVGQKAETVLAAADRGLYEAKREGRNQVRSVTARNPPCPSAGAAGKVSR